MIFLIYVWEDQTMRKSRFSDRASARRRAKRRRRGLFKACRANRARRFARGGAHRSGSVRGDDGRHGALRRLRHRRSRRPRCSRYTNPTSAWSPSTAPRVHPANGGPSRPRRARSPGAMRAACGGRSGDVDLCAVRVQPVDGLGLVAVQLPGAHVMAVRPGNVDQLVVGAALIPAWMYLLGTSTGDSVKPPKANLP